jgi:hypothetical protein
MDAETIKALLMLSQEPGDALGKLRDALHFFTFTAVALLDGREEINPSATGDLSKDVVILQPSSPPSTPQPA